MRNRRSAAALWTTRIAIATPMLAAAAFLYWLGVAAPARSREIMEAFRVRDGAAVPAVVLRDTLGAAGSLAQKVAGERALVVVMDPECGHCHTQLQSIQALLARTPAAHRPRVVAVSVGRSDLLKEAARKYPGLPLYDDERGIIRGRLGLQVVPASFTVDAAGRVGDVRVGVQPEPYMVSLLGTMVRAAALTPTAAAQP
jgi:cytochrome oxidase Cu insertion factor (SCO1/SenC/PrrC family)